MYLSRSKRASAWIKQEADTLFLPPVCSVKHLCKAVQLPLNAVVKTFCKKNGKSYWFRHNQIHYEFNKKSQILFPYEYAVQRLKKHYTNYNDVNNYKLMDIEPETLNLEQYTQNNMHVYDENHNKKQAVIAIMGHVNHGKTTLLDTIRHTNIADHESGAITQGVSCYHYNLSPRNCITFIDTPGHEVFFKMRSNSVIVADAVVLVIDIMEGVQKQTMEVIKKAKQLSIPLVLALNKIDTLNTNTHETSRNYQLPQIIHEIKTQLAHVIDMNDEQSLAFDIVPISAKYNENINELLLSLDVLSNALQLMSPHHDIQPQAIVLEASSDNCGSYLMLIIHCGTLQVNDIIVGGYIAGKIRNLMDPTNNTEIERAFPGMAVKCYITRFSDISRYNATDQLPKSGEIVFVLEDKPHAAQVLEYRMMCDELQRSIDVNRSRIKQDTKDVMQCMDAVDDFIETDYDSNIVFNTLSETSLKDKLFDDEELDSIEDTMNRVNDLNKAIILRCDSIGSLNVLKQIIYESQYKKGKDVERVKIVECGVGNVTVNDLETQEHINANQEDECVIYMFNVGLSVNAKKYMHEMMMNIHMDSIREFRVFTELQKDVYQWLGYHNHAVRDVPMAKKHENVDSESDDDDEEI